MTQANKNAVQSFIRMVGDDFQDLSGNLVSQHEKIRDEVINRKLDRLKGEALRLSVRVKKIADQIALA
jgi:hypothetical protein